MFTHVYLEALKRKKERWGDNKAERQREGVTEREKKSLKPQEGPLFENH